MSLEQVVSGNDHRASLVALRDYLARALDQCDSLRDAGTLSARLADVLAQIAELPDKSEVSAADEIAARRAARHPGAAGQARA